MTYIICKKLEILHLLLYNVSINHNEQKVNNNFLKGVIKVKNVDIRTKAKEKNVCLWEIATELGLSDANFSRKLRVEFSSEEKENIFGIIEKLAKK